MRIEFVRNSANYDIYVHTFIEKFPQYNIINTAKLFDVQNINTENINDVVISF